MEQKYCENRKRKSSVLSDENPEMSVISSLLSSSLRSKELMHCSSSNTNNEVMESFRLEKTSEITESNLRLTITFST